MVYGIGFTLFPAVGTCPTSKVPRDGSPAVSFPPQPRSKAPQPRPFPMGKIAIETSMEPLNKNGFGWWSIKNSIFTCPSAQFLGFSRRSAAPRGTLHLGKRHNHHGFNGEKKIRCFPKRKVGSMTLASPSFWIPSTSWVTDNRASYMKKHWDINKKVLQPTRIQKTR